MLKVVELESWKEFEKVMSRLTSGQIAGRVDRVYGIGSYAPTLFRGQPNADFPLDTTLERALGKNKTVRFYLNLIKSILPEIEAFTDKKWDIFTQEGEKNDKLEYIDSDLPFTTKEFPIGYMSYLRHYGFPSPLLDWSFSPYIAAYFAFRNLVNNAEKVAIYAYNQGSDYSAPKHKKTVITPLFGLKNIQNNKRHYLQQSIYTICIDLELENAYEEMRVPYFAHHESVYVEANEPEKSKDYYKSEFLIKYVLPASEKETALLSLDMYNINSFSLMGSEESLLETLFVRHAAPIKKNNFNGPTIYEI